MDIEAPIPASASRRRKGTLLFVPQRWQRRTALVTLKRVHAWTGLWGAALFLLMGSSGVLLNHQTVLPIDTGGPVAVDNVRLPVRAGVISSEAMLGPWTHDRLDLPASVVPYPAPDAAAKLRSVRFLDRNLATAPVWARTFYLANQQVTAIYVPGSTAVTAKVEALGILGVVKNLHKGIGLGIVWVLLIDTIAGALIAMSVTGFLLWSRLHGSRLLAGGLAIGAIIWALIGSLPLLR